MKMIVKIAIIILLVGLCFAQQTDTIDSTENQSAKPDSVKKVISSKNESTETEKSDNEDKYDYFTDEDGDGVDDLLRKLFLSDDSDDETKKSSNKSKSYNNWKKSNSSRSKINSRTSEKNSRTKRRGQ